MANAVRGGGCRQNVVRGSGEVSGVMGLSSSLNVGYKIGLYARHFGHYSGTNTIGIRVTLSRHALMVHRMLGIKVEYPLYALCISTCFLSSDG